MCIRDRILVAQFWASRLLKSFLQTLQKLFLLCKALIITSNLASRRTVAHDLSSPIMSAWGASGAWASQVRYPPASEAFVARTSPNRPRGKKRRERRPAPPPSETPETARHAGSDGVWRHRARVSASSHLVR